MVPESRTHGGPRNQERRRPALARILRLWLHGPRTHACCRLQSADRPADVPVATTAAGFMAEMYDTRRC